MHPPPVSLLAILLGLGYALPNLMGVVKPTQYAAMMRKFPRQTSLGYVLMLGATVWFLSILSRESISDFASFKPALYVLFAGVGLGACLFVQDFLAVRGLAVLFLLLGKFMVDTGRPYLDITGWVLVIQTWAYVWVVLGMWFTISPWRLRDLLNWATANEKRVRTLSLARLALAILLLALGLTVFPAAEKRLHELEHFDPTGPSLTVPSPQG